MEIAFAKKLATVSARYCTYLCIGISTLAVGVGLFAYGLSKNSKKNDSGKDWISAGIYIAAIGSLVALLSVGICVLTYLWTIIKVQWQDDNEHVTKKEISKETKANRQKSPPKP